MSATADEYRDCAELVARELLGEPNRRLSKAGEFWGNHGSLALKVKDGVFFDHETKKGGGVRWFLHRGGPGLRLCGASPLH